MSWVCLWEAGCRLGEGPLWCADTGTLLFVDIKAREILSWRDGATARFGVPSEIGCIVKRRQGGLAAALRDGIAFVTLDPFTVEMALPVEADLPGNRFNDGKVDPQGRLWAASMDDACKQPTGAIWRIGADLAARRMAGGHIVGNGFGWSPDGATMYFTDSENRTILAYDFADGEISGRRVFATVAPEHGYPDGLTVDAEGHVWSCHWDGARVTRYRPDGSVERVVAMPVPRPTSLAFGGPQLDRLFVTSASIDLSPESLAAAPLSGALFEIDTAGVRGKPETAFAG